MPKLFYQPRAFEDIVLDHQTASNAGAVTVPAAGIVVATLPTLTVAVGQWLSVAAYARLVKGLTAGISDVRIRQVGGTAVLDNKGEVLTVQEVIHNTTNHVIGLAWHVVFDAWFRVTTGGTVTLTLHSFSQSSDSTISIGDGRIQVMHFR